jgi:type II secretory pathway component PulF
MTDRKLTLHQQVALCQHIAQLVRAKLPLVDQMLPVGQGQSSAAYQAGLSVQNSLNQGKSLQAALVQDGSTDSRILSACLEVGQASNCLDQTLESWVAMHLANLRAQSALRTALIYPSLLIVIAFVAIGWTAWYLIPEIQSAYVQYNAQPPFWLRAVFWLRDNYGLTALVSCVLVAAPLLYWRRRLTRLDRYGVPKYSARRFRLQSLATELAGLQLVAGRPLAESLPLCLSAMGSHEDQSEKAFQNLRLHRTLASMPIETTMVLASLHCGIVTRDQAVAHCRQISHRLNEQANLTDSQECRWMPVLVALIIGAVTLLTYGLLVYLPWISLMTRIGDPTS